MSDTTGATTDVTTEAQQAYHDRITAADGEFLSTIKDAQNRLHAARRSLGHIPGPNHDLSHMPDEVLEFQEARDSYHAILAEARERHDLLILDAIAKRDEVEGSDEWRRIL